LFEDTAMSCDAGIHVIGTQFKLRVNTNGYGQRGIDARCVFADTCSNDWTEGAYNQGGMWSVTAVTSQFVSPGNKRRHSLTSSVFNAMPTKSNAINASKQSPPPSEERPSRASSSTDLSSLPSPPQHRSSSPAQRPVSPTDPTKKASKDQAPAPSRPGARPVARNNFDLEPNPFEQSFSRGSGTSIHTLTNGARSPGSTRRTSPGATLPPPVGNGPETPKPVLPPLASLSSPGGPNAFGHWGLGSGGLSGSLRSGPLSPALLKRPKRPGRQTQWHRRRRLGPSHPAFRTGLTPDVGRTGPSHPLGRWSRLFPPPSPNTAAFLAMVTNHTSGVSGAMTVGGALTGDMVPGSSATITPGTLTALVNSMSQTNTNQNQPHPLSMSHLPGRFGQNNNQQNEQRTQGQFPPNSYQNNTDPYHGAAQNAAAAAANGLFLLSQAHQELTKREEAAQAASQPAGSSAITAYLDTTSASRQSDDDGDGSDDDDMSDMEGESYEPESSKPTKPKKAETEEEKRKNFLERNRQAALKCRQRKKAWLTQLQAKVEYLTAENDRLTSTLTGMRDEVTRLSAIVVAHRDCGLGGVALGTQLAHGATSSINNGQPGAPVSIPVSVAQTGASSVASVPVGAVGGARTRSGYGY
ncbi:Major Facilitator Superfamily, partial [Rhizoctonia solani]